LLAAVFVVATPLLLIMPTRATAAASAAVTQQFAQPCGNVGTPGQVHHVIWIWMENEAYTSVIDNANAPYQTSLAHQCGLPTNFHNESHGSLDNYIAATDGQSVLGSATVNDCLPTSKTQNCAIPGPSIFSQTVAAGESWRGYNEDMPTNCNPGNVGSYVARHNPAPYFTTLTSCAQDDIPMGDVTTQTGPFYDDVRNGTLPSFSFITPNLIDDAHSSNTATGDAWLSKVIPIITSGANYQNGDTTIFITNDEGAGSDYLIDEDCANVALDVNQPSCHVPTIVVAPYIPTGTVDNSFFTHYSMLRTTEEVLGLPLLGAAATANSMTANFNLGPVGTSNSPPAAPTALTATVVGPTAVNLSWQPSTAGSAPVTGYQVSRNGAVVATVAGTSFSDTTVSPGSSYTYTVAGVDSNSLTSLASNAAVVVTTGVTNLLANPGFESWSGTTPLSWFTYGPATGLAQSADAHSGTSSIRVSTSSASYAAAGINDGSKGSPTIASTTPGTTYTASCWVKASSPIPIKIQLQDTKPNGTFATTAAITSITPSDVTHWFQEQVSYTGVTSGNKLPLSIYSTSTKSGGATFEVDDCTLAVVPPAPPPDHTPPTAPTNLAATATSSSQVHLSWTAATDNVGVTGYKILRNGALAGSTAGATSFDDVGLTGNTTYSYTVVALDAAQNQGPPTAAVNATTQPVPVGPAAPTNFAGVAASATEIDLSWAAAVPGSSPITQYQITRDGSLIATVGAGSLTYNDTGLAGGSTHLYTVTAIDSNSFESPTSVPVTVTTAAPVAPAAPTGLSATAVSPSEVDLVWTAAVPGSSPVTSYQVSRNGSVIANVGGLSYNDTGLNANTSYDYTVTATDSNLLVSPPSNDAPATTPVAQPPAAPTNLAATASSPTEVDLSWTAAAPGSSSVASYTVFRNGVSVGDATGTTNYSDTGLTPDTVYDYTVIATDTASLSSTPSDDAVATTPVAVPPAAPTNLSATAVSPTEVDLGWTAAVAGTSPVNSYQVSRGGVVIATVAGLSYRDTGLTATTTYDYTVTALDTAGESSDPSGDAVATTLSPPRPPAAPTALSASATGPTTVSLSWTAAIAGDAPITGYRVSRGGVVIATVGSSPYTDTGLTPNTSYSYTVTAVDGNGLTSGASAPATTTTLALQPPHAPTGLTATATGPNTVSLSWTAAIAGSAPVTGYQVSRGGVVIATVTTASYSDTSVAANTMYSYSVTATDSNHLTSPASNIATVTTPVSTTINLLTNPGFETWSTGVPAVWTTYGPATKLTQSADAHSGTSSIGIATTSTAYAASGITDGGSKSTITSTIAGTTYTASCWVKATRLITISVALHEEKQNGVSVNPATQTSFAVPTTTTWYQIKITNKATGAGDRLPLAIFSTNTIAGGATFEVDDCSLTKSP
jgi:chitodextrinase